MDDTIDAVEAAFKEFAVGGVTMPLRSVIREGEYKGQVLFMPAYIKAMGALGTKVVSIYSDNPSKYSLPTTLGVILLNNPHNGEPLAIMDGTFLTAMRTGGVSGVATRYLARKNARTVGIIGTGAQGRTQIMAVSRVRSIEQVKAYDIAPERCKAFCQEVSEKIKVQATCVGRPEDAVKGSDIVITSSSSKVPVLNGEWLDEGTHVNAIGSHTPDSRELDVKAIQRSKLIVDSREAALKEAGDIMIPISQGIINADHIYADLGEVVSGKKIGRENDDEITIFKSQGLALQDLSTAIKVYENAKRKGVGRDISF